MVYDTDEYWEKISEAYDKSENLDDFVDIVKRKYPQVVRNTPTDGELSGYAADWNDRYLMTTESDNFGDSMRIYEK